MQPIWQAECQWITPLLIREAVTSQINDPKSKSKLDLTHLKTHSGEKSNTPLLIREYVTYPLISDHNSKYNQNKQNKFALTNSESPPCSSEKMLPTTGSAVSVIVTGNEMKNKQIPGHLVGCPFAHQCQWKNYWTLFCTLEHLILWRHNGILIHCCW